MERYDPDELRKKLKPEPIAGTSSPNGNIPVLDKVQLAKIVPRALRGKVGRKTVDNRSTYLFGLAKDLLREGVSEKRTKVILKSCPTNKFRGRDDEDQRIHETVENAEAELASEPRPKAGRRRKRTETEEDVEELVFSGNDLEETDWLWNQRIPMGEMTAMGGRQGNGKSQLMAWLAARVSRGKLGRPPAHVVFASLEDSCTKTINPRLRAAGADMDRVHVVSHIMRGGVRDVLRLPHDSALIAGAAKKFHAELVVIDPLAAALAGVNGNLDSHKDVEVRGMLAPMWALSEEQNVAFVFVTHLKKKLEEDVMNGIMGSVAFTAAPRSVLVLGYDTLDGARSGDRVLVHVKSNLSALQEPLAFQVRPLRVPHRGKNIPTSRIVEQGPSRVDISEVSNMPVTDSKLEKACSLLREKLEGGKEVTYRKLFAEATGMGISETTLKRAKKRVEVVVIPPKGPGTESRWTIR